MPRRLVRSSCRAALGSEATHRRHQHQRGPKHLAVVAIDIFDQLVHAGQVTGQFTPKKLADFGQVLCEPVAPQPTPSGPRPRRSFCSTPKATSSSDTPSGCGRARSRPCRAESLARQGIEIPMAIYMLVNDLVDCEGWDWFSVRKRVA